MLAMSAIRYPQKHPISAEEYLRMGEAGVFAPEARLELIEGEIFEMAPIGSPHAGLVNKLTALFVQRAAGRAVVAPQNPVIVSDLSVPQPDLAVLRPRADFYAGAHPRVADVFLVVEVADSTLAFDLRTKVALYARCAIPETWVLDVNGRRIHVFREPHEGSYRKAFACEGAENLACVALPDLLVNAADLFPDSNRS